MVCALCSVLAYDLSSRYVAPFTLLLTIVIGFGFVEDKGWWMHDDGTASNAVEVAGLVFLTYMYMCVYIGGLCLNMRLTCLLRFAFFVYPSLPFLFLACEKKLVFCCVDYGVSLTQSYVSECLLTFCDVCSVCVCGGLVTGESGV